MPVFKFKAKTDSGRPVASTIDALNEAAAREVLERSCFTDIELTSLRRSMRWPLLRLWRRRADRHALSVMTRQLSVMLRAGVSMPRSLEVLLRQQADPVLRRALERVHDEVRGGVALDVALSRHPEAFDVAYVAMVKLGMTTGDLGEMLERVAVFLERDLHMRKRAKSAMTYPAFILAVSVALVIGVVVFVLPPMLEFFHDSKQELPLLTRILIFTCDAARNPYLVGLALVSLVGYALYLRDYISSPSGRFQYDRARLQFPLIGPLNVKLLVAQFCRTTGALLRAGLSTQHSFAILLDISDNEYFKRVCCEPIYEGLRNGKSIAASVDETSFFPRIATSMFSVGEQTGNLAHMLGVLSNYYDEEVEQALTAFLTMLEPIMIAMMGALMTFVILGLFLPLTAMMNHLH
jgi:type IV pilus assembly protein PilC